MNQINFYTYRYQTNQKVSQIKHTVNAQGDIVPTFNELKISTALLSLLGLALGMKIDLLAILRKNLNRTILCYIL